LNTIKAFLGISSAENGLNIIIRVGEVFIKKKLDSDDKVLLVAVAWMLMIMLLHCAGLRIAMVWGSSMQPTFHEGGLVVAVVVDDN